MPDQKPEEPEPKRPGPVGWLLAGALVRNAARIARAMIANELDLRDWMTRSEAISLRVDEQGETRKDLWFDYIADTGDDGQAMHALAGAITKPQTLKFDEVEYALPIGRFVFVGGDTAYHVADETTVRARFVNPFQDALDEMTEKPDKRPLFAIPGNHDYYDNLVGFNRMFRRPLDGDTPVLQVERHDPSQEASYVKLLLPGDWELWAVDLGPHGLDYRQKRYFRGTLPIEKVPKKLILAVPTPAMSYDRVQIKPDIADPEHLAYRKLFGIDTTTKAAAFAPSKVAAELHAGECRLHIAGDDHNYQRYGGRTERKKSADAAKQTALEQAAIPCAAVIVSGGGGAFLHPTETSLGDVSRVTSYPTPDQSRAATATELINPYTVFKGGLVYVVGALLGAILHYTFPHSIDQLGPAALYVASLGLGIGALWLAHKFGKVVAKARKQEAKLKRSASSIEEIGDGAEKRARPTITEVPATTEAEIERRRRRAKWQALNAQRSPRSAWPWMIGLALLLPFIARWICPQVDPLAPASVFLLIAVLFTVALGVFGKGGAGNGGDEGKGPRKAGFAILGLLHATIQLGLPVSIVLMPSVPVLAAFAGFWLLFAVAAPKLYKGRHKWWLLLFWILQGPAIVAAAWVLVGFGVVAPLWERACWHLLVAGALGAVVSVVQYGWYMLMASAFDGHNNEVGSANRIPKFKQWIRFHVTADRLTGYVIAIEDPTKPEPKLVDVFHVEPKPPPVEPKTAVESKGV